MRKVLCRKGRVRSLAEVSESNPAFTVEKLQEIKGSKAGFTTSELTGKIGQTVDYEIIVKNTGNVSLKFGKLSDANCTSIAPSGEETIAVGGEETYTCHHELTAVGSYSNEASDTGTPPEGPPITHESNTVVVKVPSEPSFTIDKLQEIKGSDAGFTTSELTGKVGQTVDYEIIVTNTGNVPLTMSEFNDLNCEMMEGGPGAKEVAPGESTTYTCDHVLTESGSYSNSATDTGTPPKGEGFPVTHESNTVVVDVPAEPSFTIEKLQEIEGGDRAASRSRN